MRYLFTTEDQVGYYPHLADALVKCFLPDGVTYLDLTGYSYIDDESGAELAEGFRVTPHTVTALDLTGTQLGKKSGAELATAYSGIPISVVSLVLTGNNFNKKSTTELAQSFRGIPKHVTELTLALTDFSARSEKELEELRAALPHIHTLHVIDPQGDTILHHPSIAIITEHTQSIAQKTFNEMCESDARVLPKALIRLVAEYRYPESSCGFFKSKSTQQPNDTEKSGPLIEGTEKLRPDTDSKMPAGSDSKPSEFFTPLSSHDRLLQEIKAYLAQAPKISAVLIALMAERNYSLLLRKVCSIGSAPLVKLLVKYSGELPIDFHATSSNGNTPLKWFEQSKASPQVKSDIRILLTKKMIESLGNNQGKPLACGAELSFNQTPK